VVRAAGGREANVRFPAGYRRAWLLGPGLLAEIRGAGLDGAALGEAFRRFPAGLWNWCGRACCTCCGRSTW
jgi:hypothetical protein